jgi:hypothetical protein
MPREPCTLSLNVTMASPTGFVIDYQPELDGCPTGPHRR